MTQFILGIETSTTCGGVALATAEGELRAHRWLHCKTGYSRRLLPTIDAMLRESEVAKESLVAIAATRGPGSFTGVRVGVVTAKTLAHALEIPLYLFSTLECLARRAPLDAGWVYPMLDARRGEVYSALFRTNGTESCETIMEPMVGSCGSALHALNDRDERRIYFTGDGADLNRPEIVARRGESARFVPSPWNRPGADIVALLGARAWSRGEPSCDPFLAVPDYLRASDAQRNRPLEVS